MKVGLVRVREFADECGCTPQNIYIHLKNYAAELEGHTHQGRRGLMLDEQAQEFLRSIMYPKELSTDKTVAMLQEQVAELRASLFQMGQQNLELSSKLSEAEGARDRAVLDAAQFQKLLKAADDAEEVRQQELTDARKKVSEATDKVAELDKLLGEVQAERDAAEALNAALKRRGLWARIFRKGE